MAWIRVKDDIISEKSIVSVHHTPANIDGNVKESVTITLNGGKTVTAFDDEASDLWDRFLDKVDKKH